MRHIFTALLLSLFSCTSNLSNNESASTTAAVDSTTIPDTTPHDSTHPIDSGIYIGLAGRLNETNEFYISAHHFDNHTEFNYDYADSIVYENEDEGVKRRRVPMDIAKSYYHTEGLDKVALYNEQHQFQGTYKLKRAELIEDPLFSEVGLVYDAPASMKSQDAGFFYVIPDGAQQHLIEGFSSDELTEEDALFTTEKVLMLLKLDTSLNWTAYHHIVRPQEIIYTTLSFAQQSYLIETRDDTSTIVDRLTDGYHFGNFLPVPLEVNGRPVLLMTYGNPEGDDHGDYTAAFDGKEFKGMAYGRVNLKAR